MTNAESMDDDNESGEEPTTMKAVPNPPISFKESVPDREVITELNDNDVLQGRGSGSMQNTGNIRFRTLVENLRPAYVSTASRKEKAKMIKDLVRMIQSRNGRFLQRLGDEEHERVQTSMLESNGDHLANKDRYIEMSDSEAVEKTKQAIRYVHYKKVPLEQQRRRKRALQEDGDFLTSHGNDVNRKRRTPQIITAFPGNQTISNLNGNTGSQTDPLIVKKKTMNLQHNDIISVFNNTMIPLTSHAPGSTPATGPIQMQQQRKQEITTSFPFLPTSGNVQQLQNNLQELKSASSLSEVGNNNSIDPSQAIALPPNHLMNVTSNPYKTSQQTTKQPEQQIQLHLAALSSKQEPTNIVQDGGFQNFLQQNNRLLPALQCVQPQQQLLLLQQQQQQLAHAIRSIQQQPIQQPIQSAYNQQQQNLVLSSLLLATTNSNNVVATAPVDPYLLSLTNALASNETVSLVTARPQSSIEASNSLLLSLLANNFPQMPIIQQQTHDQAHIAGLINSQITDEQHRVSIPGSPIESVIPMSPSVQSSSEANAPNIDNASQLEFRHEVEKSSKKPRPS